MRLENKIAVITGGGAGIGKATAVLFAKEGAILVIVDRDEGRAETARREISDHSGVEAVGFRADVAREDDLIAVARVCEERFGRLDVLVNNAAIRLYGPVTEATSDSWDEIFSVNLRGAALAAKHLLPLMGGRGGAIVNVSSTHAWAGRPDMVQYDAMKAGMLAMTRSMAADHAAAGVRVNAVLPGYTVTDYHIDRARAEGRGIDPESFRPHEGGPGLLRRAATPEEIAPAVLFLASGEASYITGSCLAVDGGVSATASMQA